MNPIYRFVLSIDGENDMQAFPVYKDDLAIDYEHESGQQFFRGKFSGKLTFVGNDFLRIMAAAFDSEFDLEVLISYDGGQTWASYWTGSFWKTDCEINEDDKTAIVTPALKDRYNKVLAGMDKEYNLIDLKPVISRIKYDKRPMIQVYVPGQTTIGCFLAGMWWEQECESVLDVNLLKNTYYFAPEKGIIDIRITGESTPEVPSHIVNNPDVSETGQIVNFSFEYGNYTFVRNGNRVWISNAGEVSPELWGGYVDSDNFQDYTVTLYPYSGSPTTGILTATISTRVVFARYICDVEEAGSLSTYELPEEDIVQNNRNYKRVIGYQFPETIIFGDMFSSDPTKWGLYEPGKYYVSPSDLDIGLGKCFPVARNTWGGLSIWFTAYAMDSTIETAFRKSNTLNDAFPIWSVISVLLAEVAPGITHQGTTAYSQFLYSTNNPLLSYIQQHLFITPKSNIIFGGYDQPAQKAPITLKIVLDMLRDCFRCYWFIDEQNRFRIEHISWFMRGGTYDGREPEVGINLTTEIVTRNGKPWSYVKNQYKFDKPEMASRYQFGWMDDSTELFDGQPIDIVSKYVNPDNIEEISVQQFTSDIDYILLNPSEISKDGFVLLGAKLEDGAYTLPYISFVFDGAAYTLQNAYVAFVLLQSYYRYDMPAKQYKIGDVEYNAIGIKKLKTQEINFPVLYEPDLFNLIKTELGNGAIQKMSVNLSSRNAKTTLKYDTE